MPEIPATGIPGVNVPTGLTQAPALEAVLTAPLGVLSSAATAETWTPVPPGVPAEVWLRPDGTGQLKLSWRGNSEGDLDHYEYRYGTVNPPVAAPVTVQPTLLLPGYESTTIAGTSDGTTYYAQMRSVGAAASDWSDVVTATGSVLGIVQSAIWFMAPTSTDATVTLPATPTNGNLLVAWIGSGSTDGASIPAPTGWTSIGSVGVNNDRCAAFYKVASADSATVTSSGLTTGAHTTIVVEIEGQDATPIDVSTFEQSRALGATSVTAQADELALAFWAETVTNLGPLDFDSDWAWVENGWRGFCAAKFLSATGAQSLTVTSGAGTDPGAGAIITVRS